MLLNRSKAYQYFKSNFLIKKSSQNWWIFDNPFDIDGEGKRKMAVHFGYDYVKCWRTDYRGNIIQFVMDYEDVDYRAARALLNRQQEADIDFELLDEVFSESKLSTVKMPTGYQSILEGDGVLGERARGYLTSRGFDLEQLDSKGFGYCNQHDENERDDFFGYIIIPFKKQGVLQYYIGRDYIGNFMRYKNPLKEKFGIGKSDIFYNEDALDLYDEVYLLEGSFDAETIGRQAVASLGWSLSAKQKGKILNSSSKKLVMIPDVGWLVEACELAMDFIDYKEVHVIDLSELGGGKDVNEIGRDPVMQLVQESEAIGISDIMDILTS